MTSSPSDSSRRPINSRGWAIFQRSAAWLARIGVSPNAISVSSIIFSAISAGALIYAGKCDPGLSERLLWLAAVVGIQLRLIANLLDGLVAVEGGLGSATGELYNEVPDRVSDTLIFLAAGFAPGSSPWVGVGAAIMSLFVAYVRAIGASTAAGQVFAGPMAKQHRMAVITVVCLWNALAPISMRPSVSTSWGLMAIALLIVTLGGAITATRRLSIIANRMQSEEAA